MMLLNDLYTIKTQEIVSENTTQFLVSINDDHAIFAGHFPEQPIMPGVCQLQMTIDLARQIFEKNLELKESSMMKFLAMLDPRTTKEVTVKIEIKEQTETTIRLNSQIFNESAIFFKFRGILS